MSMAEYGEPVKEYFRTLRENDNARKQAIEDLKEIAELRAELGEPDAGLNEYIATQSLNEQKLDRALTKRGF